MYMYLVFFPFGFEGRTWDLIVSVPDHCLSILLFFFFFFFARFSSYIQHVTVMQIRRDDATLICDIFLSPTLAFCLHTDADGKKPSLI